MDCGAPPCLMARANPQPMHDAAGGTARPAGYRSCPPSPANTGPSRQISGRFPPPLKLSIAITLAPLPRHLPAPNRAAGSGVWRAPIPALSGYAPRSFFPGQHFPNLRIAIRIEAFAGSGVWRAPSQTSSGHAPSSFLSSHKFLKPSIATRTAASFPRHFPASDGPAGSGVWWALPQALSGHAPTSFFPGQDFPKLSIAIRTAVPFPRQVPALVWPAIQDLQGDSPGPVPSCS